MIYTVTFNPAIDYVVRLDRELQVGDVNRARGEDCVLGGKGINVSGVLAQLGCESVALGFVAGETGAWLERGLAAQGLKTDFVHLDHGITPAPQAHFLIPTSYCNAAVSPMRSPHQKWRILHQSLPSS